MLASSVTTGALTTAQMKDVFKLVLTAIRQTKRSFKDDTEVGALWKSDTWGGVLQQLIASEKYGQATGLHAMCKQVRDAARVSGPRKTEAKISGGATAHEKPSKSKAKRKVEEVEAPSEKPQKPKKKKAKMATETS